MKSTSSLFKGKLLITLAALFTAAILTTSCGYSISDSAMEEGLVPDAVSQFYDNENRIIYTTASAEHRLPVKLDKIPKHVRADIRGNVVDLRIGCHHFRGADPLAAAHFHVQRPLRMGKALPPTVSVFLAPVNEERTFRKLRPRPFFRSDMHPASTSCFRKGL